MPHRESSRVTRRPGVDKTTKSIKKEEEEVGGEERQRPGCERPFTYSTGLLSPVQESPEYARTPSDAVSGVSADELESDLNRALSQLDSETSGLQADAKEVEYIEQKAAQLSEASNSPTTPNTVVWSKGTCVELSSTDPEEGKESKEGEKEDKGKRGGKGEKVKEETEKLVEEGEEEEGAGEGESGEFAGIPKVAPSLGLKEGHDRQQLAVARSSARRRPPTRQHSKPQVSLYFPLLIIIYYPLTLVPLYTTLYISSHSYTTHTYCTFH